MEIQDVTGRLEEERDALRRELIGTQQMLYQVLQAVGEPVVVTEEQISAGIPDDTQIGLEHVVEDNCFVFSIVKDADEQPAESS